MTELWHALDRALTVVLYAAALLGGMAAAGLLGAACDVWITGRPGGGQLAAGAALIATGAVIAWRAARL